MAVVEFVSLEEHLSVKRELADLRRLVADFVASVDDEVDTKAALKLTGIKSVTTLMAERDRPGTLLNYSKLGRSCAYSRASCLAYKRASRRS